MTSTDRITARTHDRRQEELVIGPLNIEKKSNEITALPELIRLLHIRGTTVSIDAMGCQTAVASAIRAGGGDCLLSVPYPPNACTTARKCWPTLSYMRSPQPLSSSISERDPGRSLAISRSRRLPPMA